MVNTALPEDLGSMEVRCYIHVAEQLRSAVIGVEDARKAKYVEMSMLQCRQLSEDPKQGWTIEIGRAILQKVFSYESCGPSALLENNTHDPVRHNPGTYSNCPFGNLQ